MLRPLILVFVFFSIMEGAVQAQKIMMKVEGINLGDGEVIKALEWKTNADITIGGSGGNSVAKANPGKLIVKKNSGKSTDFFLKKIVQGQPISLVEMSYFETNTSKDPYYTIKMENVYISDLFWLSPECPTCLQLEHQIGFVFSKITISDKINNLNTVWDVSQNVIN